MTTKRGEGLNSAERRKACGAKMRECYWVSHTKPVKNMFGSYCTSKSKEKEEMICCISLSYCIAKNIIVVFVVPLLTNADFIKTLDLHFPCFKQVLFKFKILTLDMC